MDLMFFQTDSILKMGMSWEYKIGINVIMIRTLKISNYLIFSFKERFNP